MFRYWCGLLLAVLAILGAAPSEAQEARVVSEFGAGIHDFNQGRLFEAIQHFDAAVAVDARDPRIYFFRGLAKRRLGWTGDADIDLRLGAQIEAALKRRDVGMALQRIQGPERLMIERYRREARQLPEEVVRRVVPQTPSQVPPQPTAAAVQPATGRSQAPATRARYVPSQLDDDTTDPFVGTSAGLLGRGQVQASAAPTASAPSPRAPAATDGDDPFQEAFPAARGPVGSGVAGNAAGADPFAAPPGPARASAAGAGDAGGRGVLGAALRALTRSVAPVDELVEQSSSLLEGARTAIPGAGAGPPGEDDGGADRFEGPGDASGAEDPFADDPLMDDSAATGEGSQPEDSSGADGSLDADPSETDNPFDF